MRKPGSKDNIILTTLSYSIKNHTVTEKDVVNGGSTTTWYDTAGRAVKTTDGNNHILSETIYDTESRVLQTVDAKGMVTENIYNALGQLVRVSRGKKGSKGADGCYRMTGEVRTTDYTYDELGRNTQVMDAMEGVSSVVFDSFGRVISMKDPNQNAAEGGVRPYRYTYDEKGLLTEEENAIGNRTEYQYNDRLLLEEMTDSASEKTAYTYDSLNRLETVKDELGTVTYTYDLNGNLTGVSEKAGLFGETKTIKRTFDSLNRVISYTDYQGRVVKYAYDELGNLMELTYPGGEIVRYTYHADGSVAEMTSSSGGTFTYGYDDYGRLNKITRADGSTETREYDAAGQLVSQVDKDKAGNLLQENTYEYDVFGEVIKKTTTNTQNPDMLETVTMTYNDANRLVTYNGQSVKYDEKGNMTYGPVDGVMQELTYDCRNRLVEAGGVSYTYDAENTRIATTENGLTTEYVTDTGGSLSRLLVAYEADNTETTYYYGAEGLAAQYNSGTGKYYAYHYDNIGSTTLITAKDGHAVERFSYGTYGELLKAPITKIRFLYNGSYGVTTDSNGLYYMRARYYNPDIKRFINQDIKVGDIGSSQSLNRYAYCEGNPVSMVDPFGLCGEDANDQGEKSKYQWLHNALDWAGLVFDGADIVNGILYAAEGDYVNAAISFACGIPAVGTVIAGVAKMSKAAKAMKTADRIADLCKAAGKVGNTAAGMKANYDTYMQARREGKSVGEAMTYTAGAMVAGLAMGKAANWGANKLKNLANKALPKLKTAVQEGAGKFTGKFRDAFGSFKNKGDKTIDFYVTPEGSVIPQMKYHSLSDVEARKWYLSQEAQIPDLIDNSQPLEQQAYQAFFLRNKYRTTARELMANRELAESLYRTDPNLTWSEVIQKQLNKGLAGDDIYKAIIQSSQRSRKSVNRLLGLE